MAEVTVIQTGETGGTAQPPEPTTGSHPPPESEGVETPPPSLGETTEAIADAMTTGAALGVATGDAQATARAAERIAFLEADHERLTGELSEARNRIRELENPPEVIPETVTEVTPDVPATVTVEAQPAPQRNRSFFGKMFLG